jgi:hypothetical protein
MSWYQIIGLGLTYWLMLGLWWTLVQMLDPYWGDDIAWWEYVIIAPLAVVGITIIKIYCWWTGR